MTDIKLFLDLKLELDNLYIETNDDVKSMYNVQGFMSDDDFVDSFSDVPNSTALIAGKKYYKFDHSNRYRLYVDLQYHHI